jgi:hypothetical protein
MLSAYENGQRAIEKGRPNAFSHLTDFQQSLAFIKEYVRISEAWLQTPEALHTRYEDLVNDYDREANRLVEFLGWDAGQPGVIQAVEKYRPETARSGQKGLHFRKGKSGRFREKLTLEEQEVLSRELGPYLEKVGYPA